jgi:hypothetical protein
MTVLEISMAYDESTPGRPMACSHMQCRRVPTSCPSTQYAAIAHSLLASVPLSYEALSTPLVQFRAHNSHDRRVGAIENA